MNSRSNRSYQQHLRFFSLYTVTFVALTGLTLLAPSIVYSYKTESEAQVSDFQITDQNGNILEKEHQQQEQHNGYLGCLFSSQVCNNEEICFDDLIFGRCVSPGGEDEEPQRFSSLLPEHGYLLEYEMDRLNNLGYRWTDEYTQCILQTLISTVQYGIEYDQALCEILRDDPDLNNVVEELLEEELAKNAELPSNDDDLLLPLPESEVPEISDLPELTDSQNNNQLLPEIDSSAPSSREEDIGLLNAPNLQDLYSDSSSSSSASANSDNNNDNNNNNNAADQPTSQNRFFFFPSAHSSGLSNIYGPNNIQDDRLFYQTENDEQAPVWFNAAENDGDEEEDDENQTVLDQEEQRNYLPIEEAYPPPYAVAGYEDDLPMIELAPYYPLSSAETGYPMRRPSSLMEPDPEELIDENYYVNNNNNNPVINIRSANGEGQNEIVYLPEFQYKAGRRRHHLEEEEDEGDVNNSEEEEEEGEDPENEFVQMHKYKKKRAKDNKQEEKEEKEEDKEEGNKSKDEDNKASSSGPPTYSDYLDYPLYDDAADSPSNYYDLDDLEIGNSLANKLFNRNERLDVKKPGPFFPTSPNNFFLDKLLNNGDNNNNNNNESTTSSSSSNNNNKDRGQVEYEMPLLAPVKDKRDLPFQILEEIEDPPRYVHIGLKNRLNTRRQGEDLIEEIATIIGLPSFALTDRTIEPHHVQFHVDFNPQDMSAHQVAKKIDEDSKFQQHLTNSLGVEIQKAAAGRRNDGPSLIIPTNGNLNLLILIVTLVSTGAALLVIAVILFLVRRRAKLRRTKSSCQDDEDKEKVQAEYKQLCRDWSRSSKTMDRQSSSGSTTSSKTGLTKVPGKDLSKDSVGSNRSSTSSWTEEPNSGGVTNMDISTGHMVLSYMEDHLKNKQRLEQEWVALCGYEAEPCATTTAFKAENKKKNRYPDKLPYDHNRVILNKLINDSESDYINASTVTDHDPRNPSYIVTQGPLAQTVSDFWQMVWEQGCVVIVMLSRLQDNGYQLCHRYWPEEGSETYNKFEVHLVSEHVWCDDYLVRSVYLKNTRTGETRTVTQFHFRSWPAHGIPTSTKALLEFRRKVNKSYRGRSCPIVVHCSDGVGRSGTYVLIDMVLNRMSRGCKEIDIAATLEHIRDQRGGMVQTRQQFEFCLMAVAEEVHAILKAQPQ